MMMQQDVVYLGEYKLFSFGVERNIVYFNARRIDGADFTDVDEKKLIRLLDDIGKWEKYIRLEKCKEKEIRDEEFEQLVTPHQFYTFTCEHVPKAMIRVGRRYGLIIEPTSEQFGVEYQIAFTELVEFIRQSLISLQKWLVYKEIIS